MPTGAEGPGGSSGTGLRRLACGGLGRGSPAPPSPQNTRFPVGGISSIRAHGHCLKEELLSGAHTDSAPVNPEERKPQRPDAEGKPRWISLPVSTKGHRLLSPEARSPAPTRALRTRLPNRCPRETPLSLPHSAGPSSCAPPRTLRIPASVLPGTLRSIGGARKSKSPCEAFLLQTRSNSCRQVSRAAPTCPRANRSFFLLETLKGVDRPALGRRAGPGGAASPRASGGRGAFQPHRLPDQGSRGARADPPTGLPALLRGARRDPQRLLPRFPLAEGTRATAASDTPPSKHAL